MTNGNCVMAIATVTVILVVVVAVAIADPPELAVAARMGMPLSALSLGKYEGFCGMASKQVEICAFQLLRAVYGTHT